MTEPLELRCSALPLALTCGGSVRPSGLVVDESGSESAVGTATHAGLAVLAETGAVRWDDASALARRHGVDEVELRALLALGASLWRAHRASHPMPRASSEVELAYRDPGGAFILTGHADVVAWLGRRARVVDWKCGRRDSDYSAQLAGYCALVMLDDPRGVDEVEAFALWVRDGEVERHHLRRAELGAWLALLVERVVAWDGAYHAGPHCAHCPRSHECPAGRALVRRDVEAMAGEALTEWGDDALEALGPARIVELLARADLVAAVAARVRAAVRAYVDRRGDVVGGGRRLTLQHEQRRELDVLEAFPVLYEHGFTDDELAEIITLSLAAAERVAARRAGRGKGAAAVRALDAALDAAHAIKTTRATKLVTRRA
jgi:hypothetical protein